ncbi:hypothetical protein BHU61_03195 [Macrococcus epidermidis]|uniref:Uncharacterized protein n=1 Tax=Macrococcus epidermidis TaxID=1902580 RepID=A0A327ZY64_9STAP|nr:hypothetical protein [Macrococcus epidermidis]RAK46474.1 hypothetical protein BHU61_03195 [Macrococcus epidermidis]
MIFFTKPFKNLEDFIIEKQDQFQAMIDQLQLMVIFGFSSLVILMLSILFFNYRIYRRMSQSHIDRIKLEVERELLKKYDLELKPEYKENLGKSYKSIDRKNEKLGNQ